MVAARSRVIKHLKQQHPLMEEEQLLSKLVAYCSKEAHSCVEKAAIISFVKIRILETDSKSRLKADVLTKVGPVLFLILYDIPCSEVSGAVHNLRNAKNDFSCS